MEQGDNTAWNDGGNGGEGNNYDANRDRGNDINFGDVGDGSGNNSGGSGDGDDNGMGRQRQRR